VGHLHNVAQTLTGPLKLPKDTTFITKTEKDTFVQRMQNVEEHEKYLELQDTNQQQEMVINYLRSEIVDLKIELNHQINQLEIKLKDAHLKKDLKEHEAENLLSKVTGMKTQMLCLTKDLDLEREEKSKMKVETTRLEKVNEELIQKIKEHNSNEISLRENIVQIKTERDSAKSEVKRLDKSLVEKEQIITDQKQEISNLTKDIGHVNSRTEEFTTENKQLKIKINDIEKEILDLKTKIKGIEKEVLDLKTKLQKSENDKQRSKIKSSVVPSWR
jgi:chromosome segregation protein